MNYTVSEQLFRTSATSIASEVIDLRDAFDISVSIYTSAGTTSIFTCQVSDWTGSVVIDGAPPAASWSDWTVFTPSAATSVHPVIGPRYMRFLKNLTGTFVVTYNKHVR